MGLSSSEHAMLRKIIALTFLLYISNSLATTVNYVPLDRMARSAEVIFYGRVISNEVRIDDISQRVATFTTFEILDAVKGVTTSTYTVKQFGGQLPGSQIVYRVHGMPRFKVNEEYVVFLPKASRLGFASPIGLTQGSYSVSSSELGKTVAAGRAIDALPTNNVARPAIAASSIPSNTNEIPLENFLQTVRSLGGN